MERDELDRLYEKIEWENPRPNFTGRVLARVRWQRRVQRISTAATVCALGLLAVFGFALGRGLTISGALDYLALLFNNLDVAMSAADDFIAALNDVLPWTEIVAVLLGVLAVWIASVVLPRLLARRQPRVSE
ncbi:MAG: hypothetical protein LC737_10525 [Chloroflexi bacterium]|nr:hypothetical protein [Chloroflexota bacterium]